MLPCTDIHTCLVTLYINVSLSGRSKLDEVHATAAAIERGEWCCNREAMRKQ